MIENKYINNYFIILFSILPISIIAGSSISIANIILIDISFIYLIIKNKDYSFIQSKIIKYLLFLYIYLIFNSFVSIDKEIGIYRNLGFIRFLILFVAFNYFFQQKSFIKRVLIVWCLVLFFISIDVYLESFTGKNMFGYGGGLYGKRIVSFFKDEPIVGGYLNCFYLIIFGFLLSNYKKKNIILFFSIILLFSIFLTGERSNSIRAFLGFLTFYFVFNDLNLKKKFFLLFSVIIIFFILTFNSQFLKNRFIDQMYQNYLTKDQIYFKLYRSGYEVFKNYKIFGVGNKNYRVETCNEVNKKDDKKEKLYICTTHPHQFYFEILSEHGLFGLFVIIFVFYNLIFSKIKKVLVEKNYIQIGSLIYLIFTFLPLLPSGAFFNDYMLTLFIINLSIFYSCSNKFNIFNIQNKSL